MLEPQDDIPQEQPIYIALRNICQDYPAGGGILKELLQNADDAGASSVVSTVHFSFIPRITNELLEIRS